MYRQLSNKLMALYAVLSFSDAMNNVLRENGMQSLIGLLSSEHTIMQNEALVAIITLLASAKGFSVFFVSYFCCL